MPQSTMSLIGFGSLHRAGGYGGGDGGGGEGGGRGGGGEGGGGAGGGGEGGGDGGGGVGNGKDGGGGDGGGGDGFGGGGEGCKSVHRVCSMRMRSSLSMEACSTHVMSKVSPSAQLLKTT